MPAPVVAPVAARPARHLGATAARARRRGLRERAARRLSLDHAGERAQDGMDAPAARRLGLRGRRRARRLRDRARSRHARAHADLRRADAPVGAARAVPERDRGRAGQARRDGDAPLQGPDPRVGRRQRGDRQRRPLPREPVLDRDGRALRGPRVRGRARSRPDGAPVLQRVQRGRRGPQARRRRPAGRAAQGEGADRRRRPPAPHRGRPRADEGDAARHAAALRGDGPRGADHRDGRRPGVRPGRAAARGAARRAGGDLPRRRGGLRRGARVQAHERLGRHRPVFVARRRPPAAALRRGVRPEARAGRRPGGPRV